MKFYTEEITTLKDGVSAHALTEKATLNDALSAAHMAMGSACINENVASIHVEAKNNVGGVYYSDTWSANTVE